MPSNKRMQSDRLTAEPFVGGLCEALGGNTMASKYKDKLVEITDKEMLFHRYYFPFCAAKRIPLDRFVGVERRPPSLQNGSWRIWGTGNFSIWFPLDSQRPKWDTIFIATLSGASMRIGFTVEDSVRFSKVLREIGILDGSST